MPVQRPNYQIKSPLNHFAVSTKSYNYVVSVFGESRTLVNLSMGKVSRYFIEITYLHNLWNVLKNATFLPFFGIVLKESDICNAIDGQFREIVQ